MGFLSTKTGLDMALYSIRAAAGPLQIAILEVMRFSLVDISGIWSLTQSYHTNVHEITYLPPTIVEVSL